MVDLDWMKLVYFSLQWLMMVRWPKHIMRRCGNRLDSFCCCFLQTIGGNQRDVWCKLNEAVFCLEIRMSEKHNFLRSRRLRQLISCFSLRWVMMVWELKHIIMSRWGIFLTHFLCCQYKMLLVIIVMVTWSHEMVDVDWTKHVLYFSLGWLMMAAGIEAYFHEKRMSDDGGGAEMKQIFVLG